MIILIVWLEIKWVTLYYYHSPGLHSGYLGGWFQERKIDSRCDLLNAIYDSEFQEINIPTFSSRQGRL
jgi:hypothetical protein